MYKLVVLAIFVAVARSSDHSTELLKLNGAWYSLAFSLPSEDSSSVYQECQANVYTKSDEVFPCGRYNITGGLHSDFEDGSSYEVPAIVVNNYIDVTRTLSLLKRCERLNIFRFIGKYMIVYNSYVSGNDNAIDMFLLSKEVPTQMVLDDFIESVDELNRSEHIKVICTEEVRNASKNRRAGPRDPKKNTSPNTILKRKLFSR